MASALSKLNFTPAALFPHIQNAAGDKKCELIAKVIQSLVTVHNMNETQEGINKNAKERYAYLSKEERLQLPQADHAAFLLYRKGVDPHVAKAYYSQRLSEEDAKKWILVISKQ